MGPRFLCLFVACFVLLFQFSHQQGGTAYSYILYNENYESNCTECNDPESFYYDFFVCNTDSVNWASGARTFMDPVPVGNVVVSIDITLYSNFGCQPFGANSFLTLINSDIVDFIPVTDPDPSSCDCPNCALELPKLTGPTNGFSAYNYQGNNTFRVWGQTNSPLLCLSNATIAIEYIPANSTVSTVRPNGTPLNTTPNINIIGSDFLETKQFFCRFDQTNVPASFVNSNLLNCTAPTQSQSQIVPLSIVDSFDNVYYVTNFTYYQNPTITSFYPTSGPSRGNVNVTLTGTGFFNSTELSCRFEFMPAKAIYVTDTTVSCVDVTDYINSTARTVTVYFSENNSNYVQAPGVYTFTGVNTPTATPSPSTSLSVTPSPSPTVAAGGPSTPTQKGYIWLSVGVGVVIIFILIAGCLIFYMKRNGDSDPFKLIEEETPLRRPINSFESSTPESKTIPIRELKNLKQIEKGSFGVIYEATWHGTKIAIKKLPSNMSQKLLNEFYQEAELMKTLRHPNILQYLGIAQSDKEICICMEFMPLGSLYRILHQPDSSFSRKRIKSICLDTARGMNYLHQQHPPIVHRDLKSHNLLVDNHWQVKVCDFGLSRITAQNQTMTACGTPSWTAPEVLRNERYTTKADVYGFGVVVWEMFARADPFPGMPPFQIVFAVGTQLSRPKIDPSWPQEWVDLIKLCWNEDPAARPSFAEIITLIDKLESPTLEGV